MLILTKGSHLCQTLRTRQQKETLCCTPFSQTFSILNLNSCYLSFTVVLPNLARSHSRIQSIQTKVEYFQTVFAKATWVLSEKL